jgi:hypothetical protein
MLYREIIAVCSEIHTKHTNTLCGQNVGFFNVTVDIYIYIYIYINKQPFVLKFPPSWTYSELILMSSNVVGCLRSKLLAPCNVGTISACAATQPDQENRPVSRWSVGRSVAGPSGYVWTCSQQQSGKLKTEVP